MVSLEAVERVRGRVYGTFCAVALADDVQCLLRNGKGLVGAKKTNERTAKQKDKDVLV